MISRKHSLCPLFCLLLCSSLSSCTDVGLYQFRREPAQANKLTVSGTVCSDDPRQRDFPVKVMFVVDTSDALRAEENDPTGIRGKAVDDIVSLWGRLPNYSFGVIGFGAQPRNFIEGGFTRDTSLLSAATQQLQASSGGCNLERCRDLNAAVSLASSIITGDILAADPGEVARTSYVVIVFSGGPPVPAVGRCGCRPIPEVEEADWAGCPWSECGECDVTCPDNTTCEGSLCYPECGFDCSQFPGFVCGPTPGFEDFYTCIPGTDRVTVDPLSDSVVENPDTFAHWVVPHNPEDYGVETSPANACKYTCVYPDGGHTGSCEELQLVSVIRELSTFARENGAAQLQVHTTYLPDKAVRNPDDPFAPEPCQCGTDDCSAAANEARSVRLLSEMAFAGGGGFTEFSLDQAISFKQVDLFTQRDPLVIKELVVTNASVLPNGRGIEPDSDQDGLSDPVEAELGSCDADPDTDGDGIGDAIEVRLATNPLIPDQPIECVDLDASLRTDIDPCDPAHAEKTWKTFPDKDADGLNRCEERLLGTDDSLLDSDADGIPDRVEFVAGTNYLAVDPLDDADLDGIFNRDEIRGHTDPRANDAQTQLDLGYRYEETDDGIRTVITVSQPTSITGVTIKNASGDSSMGVGFLKFDPGPPPTLAWCDGGDAVPGGGCIAFGAPIDISTPTATGYEVTSTNGNFITVSVTGPAFYPPKAITDSIVISGAERNCLRFRVRNITLMETKDAWYAGPGGTFRNNRGDNSILIYFAEAPKDAKDGYGIFRVAGFVPNYLFGPPEKRYPPDVEVSFADDDFIIFE